MEDKKFFMCPDCKERSFLKIKKEFDGFKAIGKRRTCGLCGYVFKKDEEICFLEEKSIFEDDGQDKKDFCKDCENYIKNPYTQKCLLHNKEVTAFDGCSDFLENKKEEIEEL